MTGSPGTGVLYRACGAGFTRTWRWVYTHVYHMYTLVQTRCVPDNGTHAPLYVPYVLVEINPMIWQRNAVASYISKRKISYTLKLQSYSN